LVHCQVHVSGLPEWRPPHESSARFSSLPRDCAQPARVVENSGLNGLQYKKALRVGSKSRSLRNSA
jgi:hypothetical protein